MQKLKDRKQGFDWLFEFEFELPSIYTTVENDKVYLIMKKSLTDEDTDAKVNTSITLTDSTNLSSVSGKTIISGYVPVAKATTTSITPGRYYCEMYYEIQGTPTIAYDIDGNKEINIIDAVKDA